MEAFILSAVEQGVMTITLNRPDRLNSFNDLMHHQLAECLKQAELAERHHKFGRTRGQHDIAAQRQGSARAGGHAVNRADDRFRQRRQMARQLQTGIRQF